MSTTEQTTPASGIQNQPTEDPASSIQYPELSIQDQPTENLASVIESPLTNSLTHSLATAPPPFTDSLTHSLTTSHGYRVKEERALIQRRTVEPTSEPSTLNLQPSTSHTYECVISAPPTAGVSLSRRARNGKIARLPKLERDLVNKLLQNNIPHSKIVWALQERGITVTKRNISNWHTRGGYKDWCAEQENQLRLAHLQDHLTDYLRKHDAQQLPEVGLQVASTQLTSLLMNPQTAAPLLADPNKFARIVEALDKCSVRLAELQKERYEAVRRASIKDSVQNIRCEDAKDVESLRKIASAEELAKSAREDDIPHRNELPPREEMPYIRPSPSLTTLDLLKALAQKQSADAKPKQLANASSNDPQTTVPGNSQVTHG